MKVKVLTLVVIISILISNISLAENAEGKTIRLEKYTGNVSVMTGAGNTLKTINKMRLFDGYTIMTSKDATAYLSIDNAKSLKLDQNTKISIVKKDKVNEIQVISGSVFFSVKEKLKDDETLDIVTPTMAIGIRGTTGTVSVKKKESRAQIYSGKVIVKNRKGQENTLNPGQEIRENKEVLNQTEIVQLKANGEDIPSFSLNEINNNKEIRKQISEVKIFELDKFVEAEKVNKSKEEVELKQELQKIEEEKQGAKSQKAKNVIESTKEKIEIEKEVIGPKELEDEYEVINKGESVDFENSKGSIYVFEIDENTGTAELKEVVDFSGDVEIKNTKKGSIEVFDGEETNDLGGKDYEGAYKIIE